MTSFASIGSVSGILPPDFNINVNTIGNNETTRIKAVSKAMETLFANQLSEEMGKEIQGADNPDDPDSSNNNAYGDFIQQALSQGLTSGKGLGLAQQIEQYLTRREHPIAAPYMHTSLHHVQPAK
jgi:Rod binding domain-containing protein